MANTLITELLNTIDTNGAESVYEKIIGDLNTDYKSEFFSYVAEEENPLNGRDVYKYMNNGYSYFEAIDKMKKNLLDSLNFNKFIKFNYLSMTTVER